MQQHRIISRSLKHAIRWGLVGRNVAQAVDPPSREYIEPTVLDATGVESFLKGIKESPYHALFHLDIHTGLRRFELLGLRWKDVDLMMATISIVQVMHRLQDGRIIFAEPKTRKGRRSIALTPSSAVTLGEHQKREAIKREALGLPLTTADLVFSNPDGSPLSPSTVTHAFKRLAARAGLFGVRLQDLRHTHASLMLQQGVHPKIVQERLGHSTIVTTMDIYSHVLPGMQEAAARKFEEGLAQKPAKKEPARLQNVSKMTS